MSIFATKPVERIEREQIGQGEATLKRVLGPGQLVLLGVGAIIGTGIFVLTGQAAAANAGPAIVLSMSPVFAWGSCVRRSSPRDQVNVFEEPEPGTPSCPHAASASLDQGAGRASLTGPPSRAGKACRSIARSRSPTPPSATSTPR